MDSLHLLKYVFDLFIQLRTGRRSVPKSSRMKLVPAQEITITLPDDIEPGRYTLSVIVENCREYTGDDITCDRTSPLTFFDRVGNELGRQLTLAQVITVVPE